MKTNLGHFLDRFFNPSNSQVEAAGLRVLQRLQEGSFAVSEPVTVKRKQRPFAFAFAAVAAIVIAAVSVTFWSNRVEGGVLTLADGSRVERHQGTDVSVEDVPDGQCVRLKSGSIIVNAAKRARENRLCVETKDVTVSAAGTVVFVKADDNGSHVAVIQGEVHVKQGNTEKSLLPGEQASSNKEREELAIRLQIGWSREAAAHLELLDRELAKLLAVRQAAPRASAVVPAKPQFDVASIRKCEEDFQAPAGARGGGSNSLRLAPGRLDAVCMTPATLVRSAFQNGLKNNQGIPQIEKMSFSLNITYSLGREDGTRVRGGPDWTRSDHYTIAAVAQGPVGAQELAGPLLLDLFERRFQLKYHIATEEIPVWALEIAKGGLKIKPIDAGSCYPMPVPPPSSEEEYRQLKKDHGPICGSTAEGAKRSFIEESMSALAAELSFDSYVQQRNTATQPAYLEGLLVINRTGIADSARFNFSMEYRVGRGADPNGPTAFDALEKLGLKLTRIKDTREYVVIDRIERPSEN